MQSCSAGRARSTGHWGGLVGSVFRPARARGAGLLPVPAELPARSAPKGARRPVADLLGAAIVVAFVAAVLSVALAHHPVGDYAAESDFYGSYAHGARAAQQGRLDPARFVVIGPVYEVALAAAGALVPDLFLAAKLLSVVAAAGALVTWHRLVRSLHGPAAATWTTAFLASNPVFVRYAYSATTDMPAAFAQVACVAVTVAGGRRGSRALAGALAGLATLTRYTAVHLLPTAWLVHALRHRADRSRLRRVTVAFTGGFLLVVGPWVAYSVAHDVIPGQRLAEGYGFYAAEGASRNTQDASRAAGERSAEQRSLASIVSEDPAAFAGRLLLAVPRHAAADAREVLGWPAAAALLLGLALLVYERRAGPLFAVWAFGVACFVTLLPAFHSPRYSLPMVPFYATLATGLAVAGGKRRADRTPRPAIAPAAGAVVMVVGVFALGMTLPTTVDRQRMALRDTPTDVPEVARVLAADAAGVPGARVMSRKGHIGWYSGLEVAEFPRHTSLADLAANARASGARYLYYSWYETQMRPEFAYLLDTTSRVPGLEVVHVSRAKPGVLYRITPDFGRDPAWARDDFARSVHVARALVGMSGERAAPEHFRVLAVEALGRGAGDEALVYAALLTRDDPDDAFAWLVTGEAARLAGRDAEARAAYAQAAALDPADPVPHVGLGYLERASGRLPDARRAWTAAARLADDPELRAEVGGLLAELQAPREPRRARVRRPAAAAAVATQVLMTRSANVETSADGGSAIGN